MLTKKRLLLLPAAVLLAGATGIGFVHASTGGASSPPSVSVPSEADNTAADVQQGDQTTPDVAGAADTKAEIAADAKAEAAAPETAKEATTPDGDTLQQGDQTGTDTGK